MSTKTRRPRKLASKTGDDGYRHEPGCAWAGETLVYHSLNDRLCICDPHGTKKRAMEISLDKWARRFVLHQDQVWYPKDGSVVRLDEMSLRWKRNLLAFLERRAPALHESAVWSAVAFASTHDGGDAAQDALDSIAGDLIDAKPLIWLHEQPLVVRLVQLIGKEQDGPVDRVAIPVDTCLTPGCDLPTIEHSQACAEHTAEVIHGTAGQG